MNGNFLTQLVFLAVLVGAFWLLLIRPQQQQRKKHDEMVESLQPGVRVLTIGGIFGTVKALEEDSVLLEVADGVQIEMVRGAVASIVSDADIAQGVAANEAEAESEHASHDDPLVGDGDEETDA